MATHARGIGIARQTVYTQIAQGKFPIKTYVDGVKRWCDIGTVLNTRRMPGARKARWVKWWVNLVNCVI